MTQRSLFFPDINGVMFTFLINDGTVDAKYGKMIDPEDNYFMKVIFLL